MVEISRFILQILLQAIEHLKPHTRFLMHQNQKAQKKTVFSPNMPKSKKCKQPNHTKFIPKTSQLTLLQKRLCPESHSLGQLPLQ